MNRKWIAFAVTAALLVSFGSGSRSSLAQDKAKHDEKETPLGKLMEEVQKNNIVITKGVRNATTFKKSQKEIEKAATEFVRLAKESKPYKQDSVKNAKNEPNPEKKWDEIMDDFGKHSKKLAELVAKPSATQKDAKDLFQTVKKTCVDCHTVFRVEQEF